jgi:RsiW-degrading membrane proteinase PrsW (M82 family)
MQLQLTISSLAYALLAGLVPSLIWLFFWLREDMHRDSRTLLAACFIGGMVVVVPAVFAEKYVAEIFSDESVRYTLWAALEELLKIMVVAAIALRSSHNDEPVKAMVYCITAALGFAALENTLFILGPLSSGEISRSIITGNMRFMGATLVHVVSTALVGFMLGVTYYRGAAARILAIAIGLGAAIFIHAAFNLSIITSASSDTLKAFGWIWGAVVILLVLFEEVKAVRPRLV